jgi:2-amino-4-hydroxy-6-hydroxymethyldihydropteridine diphosphokinase
VNQTMRVAYLSLGSNENAQLHLQRAATELRDQFKQVIFSPIYRTPALGFEGPDFLNAAAIIHTAMGVVELDRWLHKLEDAHGRRRDVPRFSSRCLDIDIIFFDDIIFKGEKNLEIPRPELKHAFVLKPLADIAPSYQDPVSKKMLLEIWQQHREFKIPMQQEAWAL